MKNLKIQLYTWNVAGISVVDEAELSGLFDFDDDEVDFYVVCLQEIETGLVQTAWSYVSYDDWTNSLLSLLSKHGYFLVENVRVQGLALSVFARVMHLSQVHFIKTDLKRSGFNGFWGNKGGVAISCNIYGKKVCFLNTHLPAFIEYNDARIRDFQDIIDQLEFDKTRTVLSHDIVFWFGDLNFRIENLSRAEIENCVKTEAYKELLENDQLIQLLTLHPIIKQFSEGPITFPPTYKFDLGTSDYDTSGKQRIPAWTDRILYRTYPDFHTLPDEMYNLPMAGLSSRRVQVGDLVTLVKDSYTCLMDFKQSDHKPVTAQFVFKVTKEPSVLVTLKVDKEWKSGCSGEVMVRFFHGLSPEPNDYLALYEENFTDFRSYKTWSYISIVTAQKMLLVTCKFPGLTVNETASFRIGYYSDRMTSLLALSETFLIKP